MTALAGDRTNVATRKVSGGLEAKEIEIYEAESVVIVAVNRVPSSSPNVSICAGKCLSRGMPLAAQPVIG
ncbi:hypothetical protein [Phormidium nigroviride]|uniref:hypothetical protein n=1 Tax=Phormidium nigroviride TaxID=482564 RepID=UPI00167FC898|nr:hypothetical protein [Oscillatoria nigro-viridis]